MMTTTNTAAANVDGIEIEIAVEELETKVAPDLIFPF